MMGLEFFRRSVELAEQYLQPGQRAAYTIQTNGTLLDEEWAAFFKEHDFLVGISIDGPRELHDAYRVNKGGKGSFDQVMKGLDHLRAAGVEWNALTTVHARNGDHGREVYRFLRDECDARFIQFIPIIERVAEAADGEVPWSSWRDRPLYEQKGELVTNRSIGGEQYGRFLIDVFEEWVRRDVGEVYVQLFDVTLANWFGEPPGLCVHSETCGLALALEHTGDLYSCDHFVEPAYKLGNIKELRMLDMVASQQQVQFGLDKRDTLPQFCLDCDVRFACHGGCPKDRFIRTPGRRGGPQLPVPRLQGVLPPRRPRDAVHDGPASCRRRSVRDRRPLRRRGREARAQRPVHLRQRAQVEAVPRRGAAQRFALSELPSPRARAEALFCNAARHGIACRSGCRPLVARAGRELCAFSHALGWPLGPRPVHHRPAGDPAVRQGDAVEGRRGRGHARGARDPGGDGLHEDRRDAGDHGPLHDPAAGDRVRDSRVVAPPRRRRRFRDGGDHVRGHRGPEHLRAHSGLGRVACLRESRRADHGRPPDPRAGRAARLPRRLHLTHRARRLPHGCRDPGGARPVRGDARRGLARRSSSTSSAAR